MLLFKKANHLFRPLKMARNTFFISVPKEKSIEDDKESLSTLSDFKKDLKKSKHLVVLTGAGVSAESGIPTFRGAGGLWRNHDAMVHLFLSHISFSKIE